MKSSVETLAPTRVRLTVEVAFDELKPAMDSAYKKIGEGIRIPGFRPGKVPSRIIDQRVGRGAVLEETLQTAVPQFYGEAVQETDVAVLGQPDIEVTRLEDGEALEFTAEVDVRPEIVLPALDSLSVTVDAVVRSATTRSTSSSSACRTASPSSRPPTGRPRPATSSPSTSPRASTASRSPAARPPGCPTRSAPTPSSPASTRSSSA